MLGCSHRRHVASLRQITSICAVQLADGLNRVLRESDIWAGFKAKLLAYVSANLMSLRLALMVYDAW